MEGSDQVDAARPSAALLAAIIASSDDAIISKTLDGIITTWNPAAERLFGYTAEEAIGRPISLIIPPERASEEPQILARIRKAERIEHFETVRMRKDGSLVDVSLTISPVRDERGQLVGASKIARDISEKKRIEEQVLLDRERLRVTLSSIGDGVIVTDKRGYIDFLNPVAENLTGWRQAEAHNKPLETVFSIINEVTRQRVSSPATRAIEEGVVVGLANHTILIGKEGAEIAIDDSAAPIRDAAGNVSGVVLVFRDVSSTRAINDFRERLSAIVESSDDAIISKDLQGRIKSWNAGAERIFGYSAQEAIGRPITMLIPPDRLGEEPEILAQLRRGERVDHFETVRLRKDRRRVDVSLTISPIRNEQGDVVGASKVARDITDKKRAERELAKAHAQLKEHAGELEQQVAARTAELRESLDELETFSSSLGHDLRAPLRAIRGFAEALQQDFGQTLPREGQDLLGRVIQSSTRLSRFVDNVLAYTRLRSTPIDLRPVELDQVITRVLEENPHTRESNAEVNINRPLLAVQGNENLLFQAVANLISNAVKFVAPGTRPSLRIHTVPQADRVRLWIEDNGIGIPRSDQEKVFHLFTRLHGADQYEGTGVGLAVVRRAVRKMGGEVGLVSDNGSGSKFWVDLAGA